MIVKRVGAALRRQDWTSVAIEFVLVVVGVLLGFQINNWASNRQASTARKASAQRLLGEAEQDVAYLRLGLSNQQRIVTELGFALRELELGNWRHSDEARMTTGLADATTVLPLAPPSSVYDDLVASGRFGELGDPDTRSAIAKYRATLAFGEQVRREMRAEMLHLEDRPAFQYVFAYGQPKSAQLKVDYDALRTDGLLKEKLALYAENQRVLFLLRKRAVKDASRMCMKLGLAAGRQCALDLPPPTFD